MQEFYTEFLTGSYREERFRALGKREDLAPHKVDKYLEEGKVLLWNRTQNLPGLSLQSLKACVTYTGARCHQWNSASWTFTPKKASMRMRSARPYLNHGGRLHCTHQGIPWERVQSLWPDPVRWQHDICHGVVATFCLGSPNWEGG